MAQLEKPHSHHRHHHASNAPDEDDGPPMTEEEKLQKANELAQAPSPERDDQSPAKEGGNEEDLNVDSESAKGAMANPSVEHAKKHDDQRARPENASSLLPNSTNILPEGLSNGHAGKQQGYVPSSKQGQPASHVDEGFSQREIEQMEKLLEETRGTLVLFSTHFLEAEDRSDNFLFPMDKINPLK